MRIVMFAKAPRWYSFRKDWLTTRLISEGVDTAGIVVESRNSPECVEMVRRLRHELIILRGCVILSKQMLDTPSIETINLHYALLPDYRGKDATEWSALHDDPVGVSVHWVSKEVGAGTIILSRRITIERRAGRGVTLGDLREKAPLWHPN